MYLQINMEVMEYRIWNYLNEILSTKHEQLDGYEKMKLIIHIKYYSVTPHFYHFGIMKHRINVVPRWKWKN